MRCIVAPLIVGRQQGYSAVDVVQSRTSERGLSHEDGAVHS